LNNLKKITFLSIALSAIFLGTGGIVWGQERPGVIKQVSSQPINQPRPVATAPQDKTKTLSSSIPINNSVIRPVLTNKIEIAPQPPSAPLVKKTGSSSPVNMLASMAAGHMAYSSDVSQNMLKAINERLGIRYLYGAEGPNRYDCSGFVWAVFNQAGISFDRTSARSLWSMSQPAEGDDRYKFGTLVFFNGLGHIGIVADENGFYQASSSKGITYSPFAGYWEKRIVGFRRLPQQK
jgi:cell wall-associated NlpC family hydrolase